MGVEIILHQTDLAGVGKVPVRKVLEYLGIVDGSPPIRHLDMPPPFQRREQHEQIGGAIALVIDPRGLARLHRHRCARLAGQLLGGFIQAHQRPIRIARPSVHHQHIFHPGHERGIGRRGNDPLILQVRLENVFFGVRPIVLSLARGTMPSSTTFSSSRRKLQRA